MSNTVFLISIKSNTSSAILKRYPEESIMEVMLSAIVSRNKPFFIDSLEDPRLENEVDIRIKIGYPAGNPITIPIHVFKTCFRIVPKGELTDALFT